MDNAVDALVMGFSMFIFVIALTASMYMFNQIANTSEIILYVADKTNYFENIQIQEENITTRVVDLDTVIPTLYRYYKENFCVKICDDREGKNELIQIFDANIEAQVRLAASATVPNNKQIALNTAYNDDGKLRYLFEAPWIGSTEEHTKKRIDLYIEGGSGYINDTFVDYTDEDGTPDTEINSLNEIKDLLTLNDGTKYTYELVETFVEYVFSGDTITSEDGTETITGDKQESSKIIITYTLRERAS